MYSTTDLLVPIPKSTPVRVPLIRTLRPRNFIIGVTAGMLFLKTGDAEPGDNYTLGLNGQISFGHHWRVVAGLEHARTNFKVKRADLDDFHLPVPPAPNDVMKYVEVKQPVWDFSLGLRYDITPEKRLRPFVAAAWLGEQVQEQTLKYEFRNQIIEEESYVLIPRNSERFHAAGIQIGAGVAWTLTKQWSLGLEGTYQRQYGQSVSILAQRWGLRSGVMYSF